MTLLKHLTKSFRLGFGAVAISSVALSSAIANDDINIDYESSRFMNMEF